MLTCMRTTQVLRAAGQSNTEVSLVLRNNNKNVVQVSLRHAELRQLLLQVVDLEEAADHRGSILGDHPTRLQPPQKMFESKLLHQMRNFSVHRPVFIESESSLVGRRQVPNAMWKVCSICPTQSIMPEDVADDSLHS